MSNNGKAGSGRGNNRRRSSKRREGNSWQQKDSSAKPFNKGPAPENQSRPNRSGSSRPKWTPLKISPDILPVSDCSFCGKPIRDVTSAIADKDTGVPVHFDCVTERIAFIEKLEKGESVVYIGGGRFGVISAGTSKDSHGKAEARDFKIKKVIEWENKDKRAEWRSVISEHYSET